MKDCYEESAKLSRPTDRRRRLDDACSRCGFAACLPQNFGCEGLVGTGTVDGSGKHAGLRPHPAPILTKRLRSLRAQRHVAVFAAFALPDVDDHARAVDIPDLEIAKFGPAHTR